MDHKPPSPPRLIYNRDVLSDTDLMRGIIASMSDGVMLLNSDGEIVLVNPALCDTLGYEPEHFSGGGWAELFYHSDENDEFNQILVEVVQEHVCNFNRQVKFVTPAGVRKTLVVHASVIEEEDGGILRSVLLVINDITGIVDLMEKERRLQAFSQQLAQEKLEGLDRLARAVAHEIRNPVTTIGGLIGRLLKSKSPASRDSDYLNRAMAGVRRLETVVSQVRAYADMPAPRRTEVDLGGWLADLCRDYLTEAEETGIEAHLLGVVGKPGHIVAQVDTGLLRRAISGVLDNALEAMPDGGRLTVELSEKDGMVQIIISDTGKGIGLDDLPYLFDPFFTTKAHAVGMSLAIAKRVAVEHQGDLTAVSKPGEGVSFIFSIPPAPVVGPVGSSKASRPANPK